MVGTSKNVQQAVAMASDLVIQRSVIMLDAPNFEQPIVGQQDATKAFYESKGMQ